jgi:hypothetical protein
MVHRLSSLIFGTVTFIQAQLMQTSGAAHTLHLPVTAGAMNLIGQKIIREVRILCMEPIAMPQLFGQVKIIVLPSILLIAAGAYREFHPILTFVDQFISCHKYILLEFDYLISGAIPLLISRFFACDPTPVSGTVPLEILTPLARQRTGV